MQVIFVIGKISNLAHFCAWVLLQSWFSGNTIQYDAKYTCLHGPFIENMREES